MFENQDVQPNEKKLGFQAFILWTIIGVNAIVYIAKTKDIAGLFLPLAGMVMLGYGWSLFKGGLDELRQKKKCTVCVEAVVAEHRITPDDDELPALPVFSYEYDGKICTGTLIGVTGMSRRHVRKKYPVGEAYTLFCNPEHPEQVSMRCGVNVWDYSVLALAFPICLAIMALGILVLIGPWLI